MGDKVFKQASGRSGTPSLVCSDTGVKLEGNVVVEGFNGETGETLVLRGVQAGLVVVELHYKLGAEGHIHVVVG